MIGSFSNLSLSQSDKSDKKCNEKENKFIL